MGPPLKEADAKLGMKDDTTPKMIHHNCQAHKAKHLVAHHVEKRVVSRRPTILVERMVKQHNPLGEALLS